MTLGTAPQGQGHETTAAQVVADILGVTPDDIHVRPGHDSFFNNHVTFSGAYASQFAVTGLGAVKGVRHAASEITQTRGLPRSTRTRTRSCSKAGMRVAGDPERQSLPGCAMKVNAANADLPTSSTTSR